MAQVLHPNATALPGPWRPLRNPIFRNLLASNLVSDIGTFMQSVGAAWLMTSLTNSPLYIALIQTATALPFFLLALPAGALGDIFDRRKLILGTETWMLGVAVVLTVATVFGVMTPWLLLLLTLGLSIGDAVEVSFMASNISRARQQGGPACRARSEWDRVQPCQGVRSRTRRFHRRSRGGGGRVFLQCHFILGRDCRNRAMEKACSKEHIAIEDLPRSTTFLRLIRYVRYFPGIRTLLLRSAVLIFFTSSFWALLPTAAKDISRNPITYGFLLGFFGLGAVAGAMVLQQTRSKVSSETLLSAATATFAGVILSLAPLRSPLVLCFVMLLGGAAWTSVMSLFNIVVQELAPDWVRARVLAVYLFVFQGSVGDRKYSLGICGTAQGCSRNPGVRRTRNRSMFIAAGFVQAAGCSGRSQFLEPLG